MCTTMRRMSYSPRDLADLDRERIIDAERALLGLPADDGFTPDEDDDLDALLEREANR